MRKGLYAKLAFQNLRKNKSVYLPFLAASALMVFVFYMACSFSMSDEFGKKIQYGGNIQMLMLAGSMLLPFVCAPFIWYINSFLMKRRKRELGLYGILGLERKHVAKVMLFENLYSLLFSLAVGILSGVVFGKLLFLLLLNLTGSSVDMDFQLSVRALLVTVILFAVIFAISLLNNLLRVSLSSPIALLQEEKKGEKNSKLAPLIAIVGVGCLAWGYWISLHAAPNSGLINDFFMAVLLVVIGTYGIFTAGSNYFLRALKANKKFYYKTQNFVTVSGMIHRMRKNAAGLVNICIFSTMVLVAVICAVAIYSGQASVLELAKNPPETISLGLNLKALSEQELMLEFGTLTFLGIFFAVIFFGCTILIMYYKQITEGYEDASRFQVMRQVGMGEKLVKSTIKRQILMIFFIPLIGAVVHTSVAIPILIQLLSILFIRDIPMILTCIGCSVAAFALVYILMYLVTAKTYYKMVK